MTDFLERALALADETLGLAYPKPDVGAVLVRDGEVVGEGTTELRGRHGEIVALDAAGARGERATLFVTIVFGTPGQRPAPLPESALGARRCS